MIESSYMWTILAPVIYIILESTQFIKSYFNERILRIFNFSIISIMVILTPIFYIYKFGIRLCITWVVAVSLSFLLQRIFYKNTEKESYYTIEVIDKYIFYINVLIGIVMLVYPHTQLFYKYGGGISYLTDIVSKILISLSGIISIFLNQYILYLIYKWKNR